MTFWTRVRRTPTWWIPIVLVVIVSVAVLVQVLLRGPEQTRPSATSTASHTFQSGPPSFARQLQAGKVEAVVIDDVSGTIDVTTRGPVERYRVEYLSQELIALLTERSA
jgi:hypothetical protein